MTEVLLVTGDDPRRRHRFVQAPLEAVGVSCTVVRDRGRGMSPCSDLQAALDSTPWSAIVIFGGDIRVGHRIAESRRRSAAPVLLRYGGDPFANRRMRSIEWVKRGRFLTAARSMTGSLRTRRAIRTVDGIVAVGPTLLRDLRAVAGPKVEGVVAPPVIELPALRNPERLGPEGPFRIVTISNFEYRAKSDGIDALAVAFREVAATSGRDLRFDVVGGGLHGEEVRSRWEGRHGSLEIRCHGKVADVAPHLQDADLFAYCSGLDAYGLSILEAQACGLPVMVNDHGFTRDFLVDGEDAMFFDATDPADAIRVASELVESPELRRALAERGRAAAERRNDPVAVGERLLGFIRGFGERGRS